MQMIMQILHPGGMTAPCHNFPSCTSHQELPWGATGQLQTTIMRPQAESSASLEMQYPMTDWNPLCQVDDEKCKIF